MGDLWWSRADFERSENVATRTAQLRITKPINRGSVEVNGSKGRAVRYRYTQAATIPRRFETDGQSVEAVPPLGWNGKSPLFARAELVRPVFDGFFEGV